MPVARARANCSEESRKRVVRQIRREKIWLEDDGRKMINRKPKQAACANGKALRKSRVGRKIEDKKEYKIIESEMTNKFGRPSLAVAPGEGCTARARALMHKRRAGYASQKVASSDTKQKKGEALCDTKRRRSVTQN